jgi:tetratricopeptide (TPR) repeat protein
MLPRHPRGYLLDVSAAVIDTHDYGQLSREGRTLAAAGRWTTALDRLRAASDLWRGSPFMGIDSVPDLSAERDRLVEKATANRLIELQARLEVLDPGDVVAPLRELTAQRCWDERGWVLLMLALYRSGRQTEALEAARTARRKLAEESGLDPSEELVDLERRILQQDPRLKPLSTYYSVPRWLRPPATPLCGRAPQLGELIQWWHEADMGGGRQLALVTGEAGIGKSRLAASFAEEVSRSGATVVAGRCFDAPRLPLQPWTDLLGDHLPHRGVLEPAFAGEALVDVWEVAASELFAEVMKRFDALLASGPVLVVMEDVQWAGVAALRILEHLLNNCQGREFMVLATVRTAASDISVGTERALAELATKMRARELLLTGLDDDSFAKFLSSLGHGVTAERAASLRKVTGGVPLLAMAALDGGRDIVATPLGRVGNAAVGLAEVLAVAGGVLSMTALRHACDLDEDDVDRSIDELIAVGLLRQTDDVVLTCEFTHSLYRDALSARISDAHRLVLARRLLSTSDVLPGHFLPPGIAALAVAVARSGLPDDVDRAISRCRLAGDWSTQLHEHREAAQWCSEAIAAASRAGIGAAVMAELELARGLACRRAGLPFRDEFVRAAESARDADDVELLARVCAGWSRGHFGQVWVTDDEYVAHARHALADSGRVHPQLRARVMVSLAAELTWAEDTETERFALADAALALARSTGDAATLAYVLHARNLAIAAADTLDVRRDEMTELRSVASRLDDSGVTFQALLQTCGPAIEDGDITLIATMLEEADVVANSLRQPILQWMVAWSRASLLLWQGRLSAAEELARTAARQGADAGFGTEAALFLGGQLLEIRRLQGRIGELAPRLAAVPFQPHGALSIARYQYQAGLVEMAAARLDQAIPAEEAPRLLRNMAERSSLDHMAFLAVNLHRPVLAQAAWQRLSVLADTFGHDVVANPIGHHWLGVLAAELGRPDEAVEHLERAVARQMDLGMPLLAAESQRELGWMYEAVGDTAHARAAHTEVRRVAALHGAEGLIDGLTTKGRRYARYS